MKYEKYEPLSVSDDSLEFRFISKGPKGNILKAVQFIEIYNSELYNLEFGDLLSDGTIDDRVKNDNKDRNKILASIVLTVYEFTARYQDKLVFFTGSTEGRTRLFRMTLSNNFNELIVDFEIYGVSLIDSIYSAEPFLKDKEYFGFLIKRKIV